MNLTWGGSKGYLSVNFIFNLNEPVAYGELSGPNIMASKSNKSSSLTSQANTSGAGSSDKIFNSLAILSANDAIIGYKTVTTIAIAAKIFQYRTQYLNYIHGLEKTKIVDITDNYNNNRQKNWFEK